MPEHVVGSTILRNGWTLDALTSEEQVILRFVMEKDVFWFSYHMSVEQARNLAFDLDRAADAPIYGAPPDFENFVGSTAIDNGWTLDVSTTEEQVILRYSEHADAFGFTYHQSVKNARKLASDLNRAADTVRNFRHG